MVALNWYVLATGIDCLELAIAVDCFVLVTAIDCFVLATTADCFVLSQAVDYFASQCHKASGPAVPLFLLVLLGKRNANERH